MAESAGDTEMYVEKFRLINEPTNHWKARKTFLVNNWDEYPEMQLVSLSMVWANMQFDGCRYAEDLMDRVRDMARGISDSDEDPKSSVVSHIHPAGRSAGSDDQKHTPRSGPSAPKRPYPAGDGSRPGGDGAGSQSSALQAATDVNGNQIHVSQGSLVATLYSSHQPSSTFHPLMFDKLCSLCSAFKAKCQARLASPEQLKFSFWQLVHSLAFRHRTECNNIDNTEKHNPKWKAYFILGETLCATHVANSKKVAKEGAVVNLINLWKNHRAICLISGSSGKQKEFDFRNEMVYLDQISKDISYGFQQPVVKDVPQVQPEERKTMTVESIMASLPREFAMHQLNRRIVPAPKLPNFYLIEFLKEKAKYGFENPVSKLVNSASMCKIPLEFSTGKFMSPRQTPGHVCTVFMSSCSIATGLALGSREAKHLAAHHAIEALKVNNATLRKTDKFEGPMVSRDELTGGSSKEEAVPETNVGHKLLKMMGWKGEGVGLGKKEEGIADPVKATGNSSNAKEGLGFDLLELKDPTTKRLDERKVWEVLEEYARSGREEELIFTTDLSLDERKKLHTMSCRLGLKSKSKGKGTTRYLTIGRKWDISSLVQSVAEKGGNTGKFELVGPMTNSL